jgi:Fe-S cluster biogenesis protein NfuA
MPHADAMTAAARVEELLGAFADDPRLAEAADELVRTLVEFYGDGLGRLVEFVAERPGGAEIIRAAAADTVVSGLLVLYDLHPDPTYERVAAALRELGTRAGDLELIGVDDGVVRLRSAGTTAGCPSSSGSARRAVERAIERVAPEVARIDIDGVPSSAAVPGPGGRTTLPVLGAPMGVPAGSRS